MLVVRRCWPAAVQHVERGGHEIDVFVRLLDGKTRSGAVTSAQILEYGKALDGLNELRSYHAAGCSVASQLRSIALVPFLSAHETSQCSDDMSVRGHHTGSGGSSGELAETLNLRTEINSARDRFISW